MANMIPKTIHYIWFGGKPLTPLANKCVASWEKYCPDYRIVRWDESNFNVNMNRYCREAYEAKKWAFASDYARLWLLVNEGGFYLDTDVELLRPLDRFLDLQAFSGFEADNKVAAGIMGSCRRHPIFMELLKGYDARSFVDSNGQFDITTIVEVITKLCSDLGAVLDNTEQTINGFSLFPSDYFYPKSWNSKELHMTENTYAIHHYRGSWITPQQRFHSKLEAILGKDTMSSIKQLLGRS